MTDDAALATPGQRVAAEVHWGTRQGRILRFLHTYLTQHGYPPSMREVAAAVGLTSSSSVAHHLSVLEERGHIRRDPNLPRAITLYTLPPPPEHLPPPPPAGRWCRLHDDAEQPCVGDLFLVTDGASPYTSAEVCAGHLADAIPHEGATVHRLIP